MPNLQPLLETSYYTAAAANKMLISGRTSNLIADLSPNYTHVIHRAAGESRRVSTELPTVRILIVPVMGKHGTAPSHTAKRPGAVTPGPLLIRSHRSNLGGTLNESTDPLSAAASQHLGLLKEQHERLERDDRYYVGLAFTYGLTVPEIAEQTGLEVSRVRQLLAGE